MSDVRSRARARRATAARLLPLFAAGLLAGCGGDSGPTEPPGPTPVASITITPDTALAVVGATLQLTATLHDSVGATLSGRAITWTSSDTSIATIDSTGLITGRAPGPVTITATAEGRQGVVHMRAVRRFVQVYTGGERSCALSPMGLAYCWGTNSSGELGDGTTTDRAMPWPVAGGLVFTQLALGYNHACGVTETGEAYCWGYNADGEVGDGSTTDRLAPTPVAGDLLFTQLVAGLNHTCGLTAEGRAYCWGDNVYGQLGDGTTSDRTAPTPVSGNLVFAALGVEAGRSTCGIVATGAAYCWGANDWGQLGDSTTTNRPAPVAVKGGLAFAAISTAHSHSCALTADGSAYCWGANAAGTLGTDSTGTMLRTPTEVTGGIAFTEISVGGSTCGISTAHVAYCWGSNGNGQLGDGTRADRTLPTPVAGGLNATQVAAAGDTHACILTTEHTVYCWGTNYVGQLGDGTPSTTDQLTPVAVQGQE